MKACVKKSLAPKLPDLRAMRRAPPAAVLTAMADELTAERRQSILARIPMARFLEADEVAAQVAWLCSADCSFATAAVFDLSGGRATC